jgi:hypothetical protein
MEGVENIIPKDISEQFQNMDSIDFFDFLRTQKNESFLIINIDLSGVTDKILFRNKAIELKAFLEDSYSGQRRVASIRCKKEQIDWEPNAFNSGVKRDLVD